MSDDSHIGDTPIHMAVVFLTILAGVVILYILDFIKKHLDFIKKHLSTKGGDR